MWIRAALLAIVWALGGRAEVLDRLAVSMDNNVITEHQVIQQLRLAALENQEPLDLSGPQKRKAAEQLVERRLIEREMQLNRYTGAEPDAVEAELKRIKNEEFKGEANFAAALKMYGVSEEQVRQFIRDQLGTLRFIELRFRPAIQVSNAEMADYYQNEFLPDWQKKSKEPPPSEDKIHDQLEQAITRVRETQALDRWLGETRRQTDIRWQQEVFR